MSELSTLFLVLLALALVWLVLKLIFKLTLKIFSCGCLLILGIVGLIFFLSYSGLY